MSTDKTTSPEKTLLPEKTKELIENNFSTPVNFDHAQRVAKMFSTSSLIPKDYQNNVANTMIAMEMATRMGANPLMVMQNLFVVQGRPSWSSSFIIAALNACKRFSPIRFKMNGEGKELTCIAWAYDLDSKEVLEGPEVSIAMAEAEGWLQKNGSKWKTMPGLMIRYRAAAFFGRLYAPDILMGLLTTDEVQDIQPVKVEEKKRNKEEERIALLIADAKTIEDLVAVKPFVENEFKELSDTYELKFAELSEKEV